MKFISSLRHTRTGPGSSRYRCQSSTSESAAVGLLSSPVAFASLVATAGVGVILLRRKSLLSTPPETVVSRRIVKFSGVLRQSCILFLGLVCMSSWLKSVCGHVECFVRAAHCHIFFSCFVCFFFNRLWYPKDSNDLGRVEFVSLCSYLFIEMEIRWCWCLSRYCSTWYRFKLGCSNCL